MTRPEVPVIFTLPDSKAPQEEATAQFAGIGMLALPEASIAALDLPWPSPHCGTGERTQWIKRRGARQTLRKPEFRT